LGRSLGIDPFANKSCTHNCVYCQLGAGKVVNDRTIVEFPTSDEVYTEIANAINNGVAIDCVTFCGSGEPTLWTGIGKTIDAIKNNFPEAKTCIITNSSTLWREDVLSRVLNADIIIPTISAYDERSYSFIHRPHETATFAKTRQGLFALAKKFRGEIWAEVMLVRDMNDSVEAMMKISALISLCNVKYIDINTPVRPSADNTTRCPNDMALATAQVFFGAKCRIVGTFGAHEDEKRRAVTDITTAVLDIIRRRPERSSSIAASLMVSENIVDNAVAQLIEDGAIFRDADGYLRVLYNN